MIEVTSVETTRDEGAVRLILFDREKNILGVVDAYAVAWYPMPRRGRGPARKRDEDRDDPIQTLLGEAELPPERDEEEVDLAAESFAAAV
jgi:hypothetical protein